MEYAFTCECKCLFGRYIRDDQPIAADCPLCHEPVFNGILLGRVVGKRNHNIMPDIGEYRSPIDGAHITSRSQHRDHLKRHDVIEVGNERLKRTEQAPMRRAGHDIKRALDEARSK